MALVENRERVLTKDELLTQIWGDTVVEERGLTRNVSILRKTLGEKPDDHQFIVTVPARGYRFVAKVRETGGTAGSGTKSGSLADPSLGSFSADSLRSSSQSSLTCSVQSR